MNVLVAGGAGFLGSHLCERLLKDGHNVLAVDNESTGTWDNISRDMLRNSAFNFQDLDVAHMDELDKRAFYDLDMVYHLASPASPTAYGKMPVDTMLAGSVGTHNLLDIADDNDARFLLASTSEVYGDPLEHPQRESYWGNVNPIGWRSCYDEAKRYAEAYTVAFGKERGLTTRIARIFNTYGPRMRLDDGRPMNTFIVAALKGEPLPVQGDGLQTRSFCYVDDTVDGLVRLMDLDYSNMPGQLGPVNIGNPDGFTTILGLAQRIVKMTNSESDFDFVPRVADDPQDRRPDIARAQHILGWGPTTDNTVGLQRTIDYVKEKLNEG